MPKEQPMTPKTLGYRIPNCIGPAIFEGIRNTSRIGGRSTLHIEDFTRARVNKRDLTAVLVETGSMPVPTKSQNPTACA